MRLSLSLRTYIAIGFLVLVVATGLSIFEKSPETSFLSLQGFDQADRIFALLGKATGIVTLVVGAARVWLFAEQQLPNRLNDLIQSWRLASTRQRIQDLSDLKNRWDPLMAVTDAGSTSERRSRLSRIHSKLEAGATASDSAVVVEEKKPRTVESGPVAEIF
jgi:hypothetical protein